MKFEQVYKKSRGPDLMKRNGPSVMLILSGSLEVQFRGLTPLGF